MRIKSLQIAGFKSFVDKTVFSFQPGITAVVGPNGCGKSNVVDAMRWAMGEQSSRRLRGKSMEDVIFAGSEARAPVGMAEVVLTFDNGDGGAPAAFAEFSEIQITRRLYRSGESEYRINKAPCRLRDVLDFFRDTGIGRSGYTIVEQGQIAALVSAKPEDRRALIETAAGIGKYKARRVEAERKLASTEQNLQRVTDVLAEIRRQIASIERQARKAARYKRLHEALRVLELCQAADERRELLGEVDTAQGRLRELRDLLLAAETGVAEREAGLEQSRLELGELERGVVQGNEALFGVRSDIKQLENRIEYERRERETLAESQASRREELEGLREQRIAAEAEAREAEAQLRDLREELADTGQARELAEAGARRAAEELRGLEKEREALNGALVQAMTAIARAEDRLAALEERGTDLQRRLRSADEALEQQQAAASVAHREQESLEEGLRNLLAERDRVMQALRSALDRVQRAQEGAREQASQLARVRAEHEKRRARLDSLRELLQRGEDLAAGTRHVLGKGDAGRSRYGWRGLVRDVLEVDASAERAVEAVLAGRAEALILPRPGAALDAITDLRSEHAGSGIFLVEAGADAETLGFVPLGQPLLDHVRVAPGFEGVARRLLGGVNLVEDLDEVFKVYGAGRIPAVFVTPRGDVLTPDGVLQGGGERERGGLSRARELRELEAEVASLEGEVARLERSGADAERQATALAEEVENLRNRHHTAVLAVASHEKDLERSRERVKTLGEAHVARATERSELLAQAAAREAERGRLESELAAAREERVGIERRIEDLSTRIAQARRAWEHAEAELTERRVAHAAREERRARLQGLFEHAEQTARNAREWIERREREIAEFEQRRSELARSMAEAEAVLRQKLEDEEAARVRAERARDAYEEMAQAIRSREEEVRRARAEALASRERLQACELEAREAELRLQQLDERVRERWSVDLATWEPPAEAGPAPGPEEALAEAPSEEDAEGDAAPDASLVEMAGLSPDARRERLAEVRRRLDALGEVNLGAIEEHEELGERFRFLTEQKADLESSIESLREAIRRINRTSRKRFRETFEAVDARFRQNFPRLFRGGKASLHLTESEDVLEAGVEIMAQPPGKRLQSVTLLSGGEKTLTALALLVSLFQVHPSPFFLLDEVDAALDDVNVERFNEIVREMSKESQFLLITHNKRTIEIGDMLYGVTMEEKGVSKLVAVELHPA